MDTLPREIILQIGEVFKERSISEQTGFPWAGSEIMPLWDNQIAICRQINKTFASIFKPLLFEHIYLYIPIAYRQGPQSFTRLELLSQSPAAKLVRRLDIDFVHTGYDARGRKELIMFVEHLHDHLPDCIVAFHNLERLGLSYHQLMDDDDGERPFNIYYPWLAAHDTMNSMIAKLLTSNKLTRLAELRLDLPCTHDFHSIMRHSIAVKSSTLQQSALIELFSSLESLSLQVNDSGFADVDIPRSTAEVAVDPEASNVSDVLQFLGRHSDWSEDFVNLVNMASHISELKFGGFLTSVDLRSLDFVSLHSLKHVALYQIETVAETLIKLLVNNGLSLLRLYLLHIDLNDGTWEEVLESVCALGSLDEFSILGCSYSIQGISRNFRPASRGEIQADETGRRLGTNRELDLDAFAKLKARAKPRMMRSRA